MQIVVYLKTCTDGKPPHVRSRWRRLQKKNNGTIILTGAVLSPGEKRAIRLSAVDQDPDALGKRLAELVLEHGGSELLRVSV